MDEIEKIKSQILELHKEWDSILDDGDDMDGFKDADCIESEVQDLILNYCEEKGYTISGLTVEKLIEQVEDDIFDDDEYTKFIDQLALTQDDVAELLWFYHHTFWPDNGLWEDVEGMREFLKQQ